MWQTGVSGLEGGSLRLTGRFQTEYDDVAQAVLSILDPSGNVMDQVSSGWLNSDNLVWEQLPDLVLSVPANAASRWVQLVGELRFGDYVIAHFDCLDLRSVPEPGTLPVAATLWLAGPAFWGFAGSLFQ